MKRIVALFSFFLIFTLLFLIWNDLFLLLITILSTLLLVGIKRITAIRSIVYYLVMISVIVIPVNVGLNFQLGLYKAIIISLIPVARIVAASLLFLTYSEYVGLDDFLDALSIILPKEVALAITLAFLLVPLMIRELEEIYLAQMMRGLALAPIHKRFVYLIRAFLFSAVMLAINRAVRIAEAIELYY